MISEGQEAWEEVVAGGRGSELGVFLTDSKRDRRQKEPTGFHQVHTVISLTDFFNHVQRVTAVRGCRLHDFLQERF